MSPFKGSANLRYTGATLSAVAFGSIVVLSSKEMKWTTTKKVILGVAAIGFIMAGIGVLGPKEESTPATTKPGYLNI